MGRIAARSTLREQQVNFGPSQAPINVHKQLWLVRYHRPFFLFLKLCVCLLRSLSGNRLICSYPKTFDGRFSFGPLQDNFCPFLLLVIFTECLLFQCRYSICGVLPIDFMPSWMTRTEEKELAYLTKYLHKYLRLSRMRKGLKYTVPNPSPL